MSGNGRKVRIFGRDSFESKWVVAKRGWLGHRFLCDARVAVHDTWWDQGYRHAVAYDPDSLPKSEVLDWLQGNCAGRYLVHPSGAVLFSEEDLASSFTAEFCIDAG